MTIISRRNSVLETWGSVDVQLKIAQKFMDHEKQLLTEITSLRTQVQAAYDKNDKGAVADHLAAVEELSDKMGKLIVNVENYPDLKSDQTMTTYNEVESHIAAACRFYNSSVAH